MSDYIIVCERAARAGGQVLRDWAGRFSVRHKGPADLVTEADFASQETIRGILLGEFPEHGFIGEEGDATWAEAEFRWIVDPLDGTTNYVHGMPHYAVSIALAQGDNLLAATVYDPSADECFTAVAGGGAWLNGRRLAASSVADPSEALVAVSLPAKVRRDGAEIALFTDVLLATQAVRRMGSAALNLAYVAAGRLDASYATDTKAWDVAAGFLLVREAGGLVTALDGTPVELFHPRFLASANATLHGSLLPLVKNHR